MSAVAVPAAPERLTDTSPNSVTATGVVRRFGERTVLDELDLRIAPREFVILLGQSDHLSHCPPRCRH
jgi:sulfonate transport system ATP-binding protein